MYLELKSRDKKYVNVPTFLMGHTKMININTRQYNNCMLVWDFDIKLFFFKYDVKLTKYKQKIIQNSKCIEINKSICSIGMDNLVNEIIEVDDRTTFDLGGVKYTPMIQIPMGQEDSAMIFEFGDEVIMNFNDMKPSQNE